MKILISISTKEHIDSLVEKCRIEKVLKNNRRKETTKETTGANAQKEVTGSNVNKQSADSIRKEIITLDRDIADIDKELNRGETSSRSGNNVAQKSTVSTHVRIPRYNKGKHSSQAQFSELIQKP